MPDLEQPTGSRFDVGLRHLWVFVQREGHAKVPQGYIEDGYRLGTFVSTRRRAYHAGKLSEARIAALESFPGWTWDPLADIFETRLRHLRAFVQQEGHARVPRGYDKDNLDSFVGTQRESYRAGKLSPERIAVLGSLPGWMWNPHADKFADGLRHLRAFMEREGHTKVPWDYVETGCRLGIFVGTQRASYRAGKLSPERIAALESLPGWTWGVPQVDAFETGLRHLRVFVQREGHTDVPWGFVEGGYNLGKFVGNQRKSYRAGKLPQDRIAVLGSLPGWTWGVPLGDKFEDGLRHLRVFAEREGHTIVLARHIEADGFNLGRFVNTQRTNYRAKKLSPERIAVLGSLPGWTWDVPAAQFEYGFQRLRAFVQREGHAKVPGKHTEEDGYPLGRFVNTQRALYNAGKLSPDRIAALEGVSGWVWRVR